MNCLSEFQAALKAAQHRLADAENEEIWSKIHFGDDASDYNKKRWREARRARVKAAEELRAVEECYDESWWDDEAEAEDDDE